MNELTICVWWAYLTGWREAILAAERLIEAQCQPVPPSQSGRDEEPSVSRCRSHRGATR